MVVNYYFATQYWVGPRLAVGFLKVGRARIRATCARAVAVPMALSNLYRHFFVVIANLQKEIYIYIFVYY